MNNVVALVKLKDVCTFENGDRGSNYPSGDDFVKEGIPFINGGSIDKGEISLSSINYITEEKYNSLRAGKAHKGDILWSIRGSFGKVARCPFDKAAIASALVIVRPKENIDASYLLYMMNSPFFTRQCTNSDNGSVQANLSVEIVKEFTIPYLSKRARKGLVDVLSCIESMISNNNAICSDLESLAKLIYDYWFVQFDFPDKNGKPYKSSGGKMVWNKDLKREIPVGWKVRPLSEVFGVTMGSSPSGESLNTERNGIVFFQGSTDFGNMYPSSRVYTTAPIRFAKAQDILVSVRAPVGDMNIAMNDCCIGRGLAAIHHRSTLYAWCSLLKLKPFFDVFNRSGTTFGALTSDALKSQMMAVPPYGVLEQYIQKMEAIGENLRLLSIENRQLASLRDFLLPMLMNGQLKVGKEGV